VVSPADGEAFAIPASPADGEAFALAIGERSAKAQSTGNSSCSTPVSGRSAARRMRASNEPATSGL
jgi:hypothetical protein